MSTEMKNPVAKFAYRYNKSISQADKTKLQPISDKIIGLELDFILFDEYYLLEESETTLIMV